VCLVRAAPGATALCSGAWSGPAREALRAQLAAAGFPLVPAAGPLFHERGHSVSAEFAGVSHVGFVQDDAAVVGLAGLPHFNAQTLARTWESGVPLRALTLELPGTPAAGWSPPSLAAHIERDPALLIDALQHAGLRRAIVPAVLGLEGATDVVGQLSHAGFTITEALAATPSIPGWRLQQALDKAVSQAGVAVLGGRAAVKRVQDMRVGSISVGEDEVAARSFVLATGKFLGGGIAADEEFRETVLGLPVWLEQLGDVFTSPDPLTLTDPVRTADQPLLFAGVHVDEEQRPVGRARDVVYENVFVAGTVRADWSATARGLGHCAEDGWTAGERASA
jgi:glycerol-3-phosphate dehydrogenase subunit B